MAVVAGHGCAPLPAAWVWTGRSPLTDSRDCVSRGAERLAHAPGGEAWFEAGAGQGLARLSCERLLWQNELPMSSIPEGSRGPLARAWRFGEAVGSRFFFDRCLLHASALTYTTLLSLVPLLALMFAVLKGLGAQGRLEKWLLTRVGLGAEVTDRIVGFVGQINASTLTTLGVVTLVVTAVSALSSAETSLNLIWREPVGRAWWRKLSDYTSVLLLSPILLLAGFGATSFLAEQDTIRGLLENRVIGDAWAQALRILPYIFNVAAFFVFYVVMPNRRPDFRAVLIAATVY